MNPSSLFHGKSLNEILAERHRLRDALIDDAVTERERQQIRRMYDINDLIFERIFRGETPPQGFKITRMTVTQSSTGRKFTIWTVDQSI